MIGGMRRASGHLTRKLEETYIELGDVWERSEAKTKRGVDD